MLLPYKDVVKSITSDNGSEFAQHQKTAKKLQTISDGLRKIDNQNNLKSVTTSYLSIILVIKMKLLTYPFYK